MGHRGFVGGTDPEAWYGIGKLQYHYLVSQGLKNDHVFLDIACGSLRLGQYLIPFLNNKCYYGLEGNDELIKKGLEQEFPIPDIIKIKEPKFESNYNFDLSFIDTFDFAIAQSLFTHLTIADIELCFKQVHAKMHKESRFYFTFFEGDSSNNPKTESDPNDGWFYNFETLNKTAKKNGLELEYIGDWGHPRNQKIICAKKQSTSH